MTVRIDLNADAGESYGRWRLGRDDELLPLVSSVNLACGFHAGDPLTMLSSLRLAARLGVAVGAHPGLPDRLGFGRRELAVTPEEAHADVAYQIGALAGLARGERLELHHVKPHGALYHMMNRDEALCRAVAAAVRSFDLPLVVPAGGAMGEWALSEGVEVVAEGFPERGYLADGSLVPRNHPAAVVHDPELAAERAIAMASGEPFEAADEGSVRIRVRTLCIHGDNPAAIEIARAIRLRLGQAGVAVRPF